MDALMVIRFGPGCEKTGHREELHWFQVSIGPPFTGMSKTGGRIMFKIKV